LYGSQPASQLPSGPHLLCTWQRHTNSSSNLRLDLKIASYSAGRTISTFLLSFNQPPQFCIIAFIHDAYIYP